MLGVVVVLDDQTALARPAHEVAASAAAQHDAGRELVGRCEQDGGGAQGAQLVHPQALRVHRHRRGVHARVPQVLTRAQRTGILHRDLADAVAGEHPRDKPERLRGPRDDDHVRGVGADAPGAGQPVRHGTAQGEGPAGIAVPELRRGERAEHRPLGAQPRGARERPQIGHSRGQVDPRRRRAQEVEDGGAGLGGEDVARGGRLLRRGGCGRGRGRDDHGAAPAPPGDVPLVTQPLSGGARRTRRKP
ncbi:hypothetical protein Misp03_65230 [Microbispora sp. NBRC 16548]|nr:hypothetical protein Misp03_65230 [Microbispora sp. NBRC 16548]